MLSLVLSRVVCCPPYYRYTNTVHFAGIFKLFTVNVLKLYTSDWSGHF